MMGTTKIQWTDAVWNPFTGCTPISEGCANCYAMRMANRLRGRCGYPADEPFRVTLHEDKLEEPLHWTKPRRVFVCSMSDLFHPDVPQDKIHEIWDIMKACPQHIFIVLTKRPDRMRDCLGRIYAMERLGWANGFWQHIWLGVTCENQRTADERIPILLDIPAAVRFVSLEPLLSETKLSASVLSELDWVIMGAESGSKRRPCKVEWIERMIKNCHFCGTPVFVKQADIGGKLVKMPEIMGRVWDQYPEARK